MSNLIIHIEKSFYKVQNMFQDVFVNGGSIPENSSHSVMDKPESVSLVKPPIIIIKKTKQNLYLANK